MAVRRLGVSTGDIKGVTAGAGLSGGGTSGTVSLAVGTQTANFAVGDGYGIVIGATTQETVSIGDGSTDLVPELQVLGTTAADSSLLLAAFSTTATTAGSPIIALAKGGNATLGSHTVVTDGEELGNIIAFGDDGTDLETPAASIQFEVDGTPGSGDMPGRILFNTTADGATAVTERLRIDSAGLATLIGALTVGVDDTGHDVKFFGAAGGAYMEWDQSEDQLRLLGPSADAAGSSGKLLLATAQTDVRANDILGQIDFQAPLETQGSDGALVTASIQAIAQDTFTATVNSTDLMFYTATDGAVTEKLRITSDGELGIGGANYGTDGQVLTSAGASAAAAWEDAGGGGTTFLFKSSDGTAVNNSTTYVSDGDLTFSVAANKHYHVQGVVNYSTNASADIKFQWSLPTSGVWVGFINGAGVEKDNEVGKFVWDADMAFSLMGGDRNIAIFSIIISTGGTSGTAVLQMAQAGAHASDTILKADSFIGWTLLD